MVLSDHEPLKPFESFAITCRETVHSNISIQSGRLSRYECIILFLS
jgi:hypothetical protein